MNWCPSCGGNKPPWISYCTACGGKPLTVIAYERLRESRDTLDRYAISELIQIRNIATRHLNTDLCSAIDNAIKGRRERTRVKARQREAEERTRAKARQREAEWATERAIRRANEARTTPPVGDPNARVCPRCDSSSVVEAMEESLHSTLCQSCRAYFEENKPGCQPTQQDVEPTSQVNTSMCQIQWEILPPDELFLESYRGEIGQQRREITNRKRLERLRFIMALQPTRIWRGMLLNGDREYKIAEFQHCVVAECPLLGNALFIYYSPDKMIWQRVFARPKRQAVELGAIRITHHGDWRARVRRMVTQKFPSG